MRLTARSNCLSQLPAMRSLLTKRVTRPLHALRCSSQMASQICVDIADADVRVVDNGMAAREREIAIDVTVAHRLMVKHGLDELTWNHISGRSPSNPNQFIITPGDQVYDDLLPEDLAIAGSENVTAEVLHAAVYDTRADIHAVVHCHSPAIEAVSCLQSGFVCLSQSSAFFFENIAYHEWEGFSSDHESEKASLSHSLATVPDCNTLMMRNHGAITMGKSVAEAWVLMYYLDKMCKVQLNVMQSGGAIHYPSETVMREAKRQAIADFTPGMYEWKSLREMVVREMKGEKRMSSML